MRVNSFKRLFRLSHWFNVHFTPLGKFIFFVAIVAAVLGIDTTRSTSYQVFAFLAALICISILASLFIRFRFNCIRTLPQLATAGEVFNYTISIDNVSGKKLYSILVMDKLNENFPTHSEFIHFHDQQSKTENWFDRAVGYPRWTRLLKHKTGANSPANTLPESVTGQRTSLQFEFKPVRRGYIHFDTIKLGIPDPMGIFRKIRSVECPKNLLVLPKLYQVPPINLAGKRHHHRGGVTLASMIGESTEFQGLRDYRPGDPIRHIHWRSWARTGFPVVKKFDDEYFVRHALILDTHVDELSSIIFEEAVSVAASIAVRMEDQESLLDLMFVGNEAYHVTSGRHVDDIISLLEVLACVQPDTQQSFSTLSDMVIQHCNLLSSAVCIFLSWDDERQQLVKMLKQRNIETVVLIVQDNSGPEELELTQLGPMADSPQRMIQLTAGKIEHGLAQLSRLDGKSQ